MLFNFETFGAFAARAYDNAQDASCFTLDDVLNVFRYYFEKYEAVFKRPHPNIRIEQIERIIDTMPYFDGEAYGRDDYFEPDHYPAMIDKHFKTQYRRCDYNINHFFSGDIRRLRYYESCYREE